MKGIDISKIGFDILKPAFSALLLAVMIHSVYIQIKNNA